MKPTLNTDTELFHQIAQGDEQAFELLYNRYLPMMQPVVLQIVKTEGAARDIVQDLFLKLWLTRDKLSAVEQPKSYIFRIAYNLSFNKLKRRKIEQKGVLVTAGAT